jgi:hypothetical protein
VAPALRGFKAEAKSRGFEVQSFKSDGEAAVSTMKVELLEEGIQLDVCGPGQHVPKVENKIKVYKTRVRAHNAGLPFIMTLKLLVRCVILMRGMSIGSNLQLRDACPS